MAEREMKSVEIGDVPELVALAEEVRRTNEPRILRRQDEDIAMLTPVAPKRAKRIPRGKPFTADDPLWNVVGIGSSAEPTNIARYKHEYIADAYDHRNDHGE